jgi:hypothetical protein
VRGCSDVTADGEMGGGGYTTVQSSSTSQTLALAPSSSANLVLLAGLVVSLVRPVVLGPAGRGVLVAKIGEATGS